MWLLYNNDSDVDINDDDDPVLLAMMEPNVLMEPATDSDMTVLENHILKTEDKLNDLVLKDIIPNDWYDFDWKTERDIFTETPETFSGTSGPTFSVTDRMPIVNVFYKMIDNDFIDRLCAETNRFAKQKIADLKAKNEFLSTSRLHRWSPTDRDEMVSFLALTILQKLYPLHNKESYFSFNGYGTMPYFSRIMSHNRYLLLDSMIHFVDNDSITIPTKLIKIQPMTDYFNSKFSSLYYPSREIVIDERLLKWRGRPAYAKKVLSKTARDDVKIYQLCECTSGYLWKFHVYAGRDKNIVDDGNGRKRKTYKCTRVASVNIVLDLIQPLLHRGHALIMNNFYNCPLLARYLKRQNTDCYGTLRLNREFVPDSLKNLTKTDLRRGEVVASYCSDLSVMVWRDSCLVGMISTYHKNGIDQLKCKPDVVLDYNKFMGGVGKKDQFRSAEPLGKARNRIWFKKLFHQLFDMAIYNCFVIYCSANSNLSYRMFRTVLAENLLKIHRRIDLTVEPRLMTLTPTKRPTTSTDEGPMWVKRLKNSTATRPKVEHRHFPVRSGFKGCRCRMCAQRKVGTRTVWKCLECDVSLCVEGCFADFHT